MAYGMRKARKVVSRKPKTAIRKPRKTVRRTVVAKKNLRKTIKSVVMATKETQFTLPTSILPVTDLVATRTVSGYITNPIGTARIGKAFPLISLATQFPSDGSGAHSFQGEEFQLQKFKYAVSMAFNIPAIYCKWRVMLVKLGERTDSIYKGQGTQPFNVEALYPDMVMESSVNFARTWAKPIGKFNPKFGTVVWSKILNLKELQKNFGGRTTETAFLRDGMISACALPFIQSTTTTTGATLIDQNANGRTKDVYAYQNYQMNMYFDIPMNKRIKDYTFGQDIPNTIPRYSLFIYEEEQSGRPIDLKTSPAMYVEEIQTFTQFKDV